MTEATDVRDVVAAAAEAFMNAYRDGDAATVAALYTADAQIFPPGMGTITGRSAIQAFWQGAMDSGIRSVQLEIAEAEAYGDTAIAIQKHTLYGEDAQMLDRGTVLVILKREGERWKLHRDIFNSSQPVP
jgi:uncharacterized protein (TIGR02246 family)